MAEPGNVSRVEYQGREIFIIGTAHVSKRSVEEVRQVIEDVKPDTVCVELDEMRHRSLVDESHWQKLDIFQVIRQKKVLFLMTSLALTAYQRKIGNLLGVKPGSEMLEAIKAAESVNAQLVLADRDVQATLKRTWHNISFWNKLKLSAELVSAPFAVDEITEDKVEQLKDRDTVSEVMQEFARIVPGVKEPLIDERDQYLMSMVQEAPGPKIVAVVGAGHVKGMLENLGKTVDRTALSELPPPSKLSRALKWVIPILVLSAFYYGYHEHQGVGLRRMIFAWVLPNSICAGILALAAGAKLLTALTAFVASPITSLNPTVSAGMAAGLVEAWLRKPTVADCETVSRDILSLKGIYGNRFTRVLWVALASTVGSAVGAWIGASWVVSLL